MRRVGLGCVVSKERGGWRLRRAVTAMLMAVIRSASSVARVCDFRGVARTGRKYIGTQLIVSIFIEPHALEAPQINTLTRWACYLTGGG